MHLLGVACNTSPAPPERPSSPFDTLSPAGVDPFDAAPLLLAQCIGLCNTAPSPSCSSLPGDCHGSWMRKRQEEVEVI